MLLRVVRVAALLAFVAGCASVSGDLSRGDSLVAVKWMQEVGKPVRP